MYGLCIAIIVISSIIIIIASLYYVLRNNVTRNNKKVREYNTTKILFILGVVLFALALAAGIVFLSYDKSSKGLDYSRREFARYIDKACFKSATPD